MPNCSRRADGVQFGRVLLAYDRSTTFYHEYAAKFKAFSHDQCYLMMTLPPILVIIHRVSTAVTILEATRDVKAGYVEVVPALEADLLKQGLANILLHP